MSKLALVGRGLERDGRSEQEDLAAPPGSERRPLPVRPRRALLAEFFHATRSELASLLRMEGWLVVEAFDADDLLELLVDASLPDDRALLHYDLIVSDLRLPERSDLRIFREFPGPLARIPLLLVCGARDAELERLARSLGTAALLERPFDTRALQRALRECFEENANVGR